MPFLWFITINFIIKKFASITEVAIKAWDHEADGFQICASSEPLIPLPSFPYLHKTMKGFEGKNMGFEKWIGS